MNQQQNEGRDGRWPYKEKKEWARKGSGLFAEEKGEGIEAWKMRRKGGWVKRRMGQREQRKGKKGRKQRAKFKEIKCEWQRREKTSKCKVNLDSERSLFEMLRKNVESGGWNSGVHYPPWIEWGGHDERKTSHSFLRISNPHLSFPMSSIERKQRNKVLTTHSLH